MTRQNIDDVLSSLSEGLASIEHERWSHWQTYLHDKCVRNPDGSLTIPKGYVDQWTAQASTPYNELSDKERQSDRDQVQRYLPLIAAAIKANS
jgi:hypothetical protein